MDLEKYKNNPKTQYLVTNLERLLKEEADVLELQKQEGMGELAETDLQNLKGQKEALVAQMEEEAEKALSQAEQILGLVEQEA